MPLEMNPEIRARWVAALRSGDYAQTTGKLRNNEGFCCLGVLCDLAEREGLITSAIDDCDEGCRDYGDERFDLPGVVIRWASLRSSPAIFADIDDTGPRDVPLAILNDDYGWDFARIADAIEGTS
jgi:hypothetical protein